MVRRFRYRDFNIYGAPSIADERIYVVAEVGGVEKAAPNGGCSVQEEPGEIVDPDVIIEDDDEDWDLMGIVTAKKVEINSLRGKMRALQEKFCSASVEVAADIIAVVALAELSLN